VPVSLESSKIIYAALKACGIRLLSALPETWLVHLIQIAEGDPEMTLVRLAKEEEGVGLSAGAHFAGVKSAMLMQNHGFLASINGIVSCAQLYRIPLLMLVSYRGEFGEPDPWQTEGGGVTEDLLRALRIPFAYLDDRAHVAARIAKAQTLAFSSNKPAALLLWTSGTTRSGGTTRHSTRWSRRGVAPACWTWRSTSHAVAAGRTRRSSCIWARR